MKWYEGLMTTTAIIVIGALTYFALKGGHDGAILYFSIAAISGLAGYHIQRTKGNSGTKGNQATGA
jgi:hypothetical protein